MRICNKRNISIIARIYTGFALFVVTVLPGCCYLLSMGVGIEVWRGRIGLFCYVGRKPLGGPLCGVLCLTCQWRRPLCLILMLLAIGCVESNPGPGPRNEEVIQRMDDLARELRDMRAVLSVKLDDAVRNFTDRLLAYDVQLAAVSTRLDGLDRVKATNAADMADVRAKLAALSPGAGASVPTVITSTTPAVSVNDVVRELDLRSSRKANIVISGLSATAAGDVAVVSDLLLTELGIAAAVTKCVRLGTPGTRPQLLLATLADDKLTMEVLRSAKLLRRSTSALVRASVYVNADLTHQQRTAMFNALMELKRRRAAGETDLVIRDGSVVKKNPPRAAHGATAATAPTAP